MSLLVNSITYGQAIQAIREIVLDTKPVQCFKVSGQDFSFIKDTLGFTIDTVLTPTSEVVKYYNLMDKLRAKDVAIEVLPDFVASEYTAYTVPFNYPSIKEPKLVSRNRYFSDTVIEEFMVEYFTLYTTYYGVPRTVQVIYDTLDYFDRRKMILWIAYYLVDRKRMNYASAGEMIRMQNGGDECGTGELKNTETTITTRVGEVFTATEKVLDDGNGASGFTSYWGDKYSYLTKLQLWIRERFEKQFKDFSLRDNCLVSSSFTMEKTWQPYAWIDTHDLSTTTMDILSPDR